MLHRWLLARIVIPVLVAAWIVFSTWGRFRHELYDQVFAVVVATHFAMSLYLRKCDVLDSVSVLPLAVTMGTIAEYCGWKDEEPIGRYAVVAAIGFVVYLSLSFLGYRRANFAKPTARRKELGLGASCGLLVIGLIAILCIPFFFNQKEGMILLLLLLFTFLFCVTVYSLIEIALDVHYRWKVKKLNEAKQAADAEKSVSKSAS